MSLATAWRVRVFVTDVWDTANLDVTPDTTVAELKLRALREALGREPNGGDYQVKFHGALVTDEQRTLQSLGVRPGAPFIVLPARRVPVR